MYRIENEQVLFDWLAAESDVAKRERMIEFMADLAERPVDIGIRVPGTRKPIYVAVAPVAGWTVQYLVVEQFKVLKLARIERLP